jgi:hypothetical protein
MEALLMQNESLVNPIDQLDEEQVENECKRWIFGKAMKI